MAPRETETRHNRKKRQAQDHLWEEIENALVKSPAVRVSLSRYQAIHSLNPSLEGNKTIDIDKLTEMVKKNEERNLFSPEGEPSAEQAFRRMVKELRGHLIKSIQTNLNLVESSTKLSLENEKLKKELAVLSAKHKKALVNIERILMNITRNPN